MHISGNLLDIFNQTIYPATLHIEGGRIVRIEPQPGANYDQYLLPGFIDAHVHIESSMLPPREFARLALPHGTVATISDPHEIANVLGVEGVHYMLESARQSPLRFHFGAPPCVPATTFETAGATLTPDDVDALLRRDDIWYLCEVMNFPGVLNDDPDMLAKLAAAQRHGKPADGHAPGLRGEQARRYIAHGISTDHECFTLEEALEKLEYGMKILIREGSAAKNFEALYPLLRDYPERVMLCSDDKHPNDLVEGHIDQLVRRALAKGIPLMNVLRAACVNPVLHYNIPVGLLREGDVADFIVINNINDFKVLKTYIAGNLVAEAGQSKMEYAIPTIINNFTTSEKSASDFRSKTPQTQIAVIEALDGQLITHRLDEAATCDAEGYAIANIATDTLKISVVNRYADAPPAVAFIRNFGLQRGAIAGSVGHDSHNIIAVGTTDEDLARVVNLLIRNRGGLALVDGADELVLPLPIAGLMSDADGYRVAEQYTQLDRRAKEMGTRLHAPYMTLSFMALLVIPRLKLSDLGLFDAEKWGFV